jgi:CheY-like chemotaxis protein
MNLVINAAESIVNTGTVTVSTHNETIDDAMGLSLKIKPGEYIVLSVRDTGSGISDTDLSHIFEPFYTKKAMGRSGTGLGLAVVWNTMEDHKGKVVVESSDQGTCFHLYFPVSAKDEKIVPVKEEKPATKTGTAEHILVIDDEPQLRDIASQILFSFGYVVDSVSSGELAIEFVKETPVDLLLIDMLMEPGINGCQTYKEILKLYPEQKAIVVSGFSESDAVKETLRLGAGGFIKKPYSIDQLGRMVKKVLNS